jgi:hypothetical protein
MSKDDKEEKPREYTAAEIRNMVLDYSWMIVDEWDKDN